MIDPTSKYNNFTLYHGIPLLLLSIIYIGIILYCRNYKKDKNYKIALYLSFIPFICVLTRMGTTYYEGTFSVQEELPLHLCRLVALVLPFFIWLQNAKWLNTLYFLIMVGTLQALITADLEYIYPHYSYILYWVFHVGLIWIPIFIIVHLRIIPRITDLKRAFVLGNIYMVFTLMINFSIGSNYFYTRHKPLSSTLLDFFGPWPVYIFVVEILAGLLFILAYLPFYRKNNLQSSL